LLIFNPADTFHADHYSGGYNRFFSISLPVKPSFDVDEIRLPDAPVQIGLPMADLIVWRLIRECVLWGKGSALVAEALCFDLLAVLGTRHRPDSMRPAWLDRAGEMLREQVSEPVSIANVSREVHMHPVHLTRTFRRYFGCTPGAFVRFHRLRKAARLLAETGLPLAEIALKSGFADQSHFTHRFRAAFGISPGKFRRTVGPYYI
jgi:AraC family transcriptional regulator